MEEEDLMDLMVMFQRYEDHIAGLFVAAEIDEQAVEAKLEFVKAKYVVATWTGPSTDRVQVKKAEALVDPEVQDLTDEHIQAKARRKLLGVMVNTMGKGASTCSRELTRRTDGRGPERRTSRHSR